MCFAHCIAVLPWRRVKSISKKKTLFKQNLSIKFNSLDSRSAYRLFLDVSATSHGLHPQMEFARWSRKESADGDSKMGWKAREWTLYLEFFRMFFALQPDSCSVTVTHTAVHNVGKWSIFFPVFHSFQSSQHVLKWSEVCLHNLNLFILLVFLHMLLYWHNFIHTDQCSLILFYSLQTRYIMCSIPPNGFQCFPNSTYQLPMELWESVLAGELEAHDAQVNSFSIPSGCYATTWSGAWRAKVNKLYSVFAMITLKQHAEPKAAESFIQYTGSFKCCVISCLFAGASTVNISGCPEN